MKIQQLRESQERQIKAMGKWTPVTVYVPLTAEEAGNVVQHGVTSIDGGEPPIVTPSYKYAASRGDVVIAIQVTGEHLEVDPSLNTPENVRKAHGMYPDSSDPLLSYAMLSANPEAYYTGSTNVNDIAELFITGYDADGNKVQTGSERISYPPTRFLRWFVSKIVIPAKRKQLQK